MRTVLDPSFVLDLIIKEPEEQSNYWVLSDLLEEQDKPAWLVEYVRKHLQRAAPYLSSSCERYGWWNVQENPAMKGIIQTADDLDEELWLMLEDDEQSKNGKGFKWYTSVERAMNDLYQALRTKIEE